MSRITTIVISSISLMLGAVSGSLFTKHLSDKRHRRELALTQCESTLQTIEHLSSLRQNNYEQTQRSLMRSLVYYAYVSEKLLDTNGDAAWIAKKTLDQIKPFKSNSIYIQEETEFNKPNTDSPFVAR